VVAVVAVEALVLLLLVTVEEGGDTVNVGFVTADVDTIGAAVNMEGALAVDAAGFFQTCVVVVKEVTRKQGDDNNNKKDQVPAVQTARD
jgi:hypothetical protein